MSVVIAPSWVLRLVSILDAANASFLLQTDSIAAWWSVCCLSLAPGASQLALPN